MLMASITDAKFTVYGGHSIGGSRSLAATKLTCALGSIFNAAKRRFEPNGNHDDNRLLFGDVFRGTSFRLQQLLP